MAKVKESTSYLLDTVKMEGKYVPGAIVYCGRKKIETYQWKDQFFATQLEADDFVRSHFATSRLAEVGNEGELKTL